jgi:ATPase subunit of ABC transporter with duplicated ATPase domains
MNKLLEEQAKLQDAIDSVGGWELERKLENRGRRAAPAAVGIDHQQLSGGEKRRVALCRLLLSAPDMLLLDEPTNHLDAESIAWLEKYLEAYPSTVIAVTHDRYFLDNVAEWILELDRGHGIPYQGNYSTWLEQKSARLAQEERTQEGLRKQLAEELEWVRKNPKARQAKSKARVARYEELASREFQERNETNEIYIRRVNGWAISSSRRRTAQVVRRSPAHRQSQLQPAEGGIVGIIGPERRRQDHAVPHDVGPREAGLGRTAHGPVGEARVRRSIAPVAQRQEHRLAGDLRRPRHDQGRQLRDAVARLRRAASTSRARASSRSSASFRAVNATACISRRC